MLHEAARYCVETEMVDVPLKPMVLEITERELIGNFEDLMKDLKPLLDFGFRLALDDFGSGYSSFLYLASLPVSFLKIEGWMVQNMRTNPKVLGMVKSIIALARDQASPPSPSAWRTRPPPTCCASSGGLGAGLVLRPSGMRDRSGAGD